MNRALSNIFGIALIFLLVGGTLPVLSSAQTPEPTLRWHTNTTTPVGYRGRSLPAAGATVTVVADGVPTNLQPLWHVNGVRYNNATNVRRFQFTVPDSATGQLDITVNFHNGEDVVMTGNTVIPVATPQFVMTAHNARGQQHILSRHTPTLFAITPPGTTVLRLHSYFVPTTWRQEAIVRWEIGSSFSEEPWGQRSVADITIENTGTEDRTTTVRAVINHAERGAIANVTHELRVIGSASQ